ncbi:fungal pheromone mating factor STE2 GPCR-domain-containing protein [Scheffersomyces xylosifermentans]|uniref:fungal pheromone mating factor STE2 GPCR-domain-containing protein n=1 Tax=Scheffersomyces xylosifermentans TaxID=1304137 RepID=UPI00315DF700
MNSFSPSNINVTFSLPESEETYSLPFGEIDNYFHSALQKSIILGVTVGSCAALLLVLLIVNLKRRKSPVFYVNSAILLLMVIKSVLHLVYFLGPLSSITFNFTGIIEENTTANISNTTNALLTIIVGLIEASITYQVFIIFQSPEVKKLGIVLTVLSGLMGTTVVGFYINSNIQTARLYESIFKSKPVPEYVTQSWVSDVPIILFSTSINITSFILVLKLALAIKTRRYLGLKQFDSFHVLLIMSTQTLLAPSILILIHYRYGSSSSAQLILISYLLVVLSLPLSSVWATTANNSAQLPSSATLSFINRTASNSSESDNDDNTISGSTYSLFPQKLAKYHSATSSKFSASTLKTSNGIRDSNGLTPTSNTSLPPDIERIINGEYDDDDNEIADLTFGSPVEKNTSVDRMLQNASVDGFVSITTHNMK